MNRVARASDLLAKPVVTLSGDDIAEVRDVVYDGEHGQLLGFTLNKRSWFGGRLRERLAMDGVHAIGADAVMVESESDLVDADAAPTPVAEAPAERDVLGAAVLTQSGTKLGTVTDVIVSLGRDARAVGYALKASDTRDAATRYVPLAEQVAVSGDAVIVPDEVDRFVEDDLAGFGAAVLEFRAQLHESEVERGTER